MVNKKEDIGTFQELELQLIGNTNFNLLNGRKVERLLRENVHLWRAAMMKEQEGYLPLFDIQDDTSYFDTLYILAREGYESKLEELVNQQFDADTVEWIGGSAVARELGRINQGFEERLKVVLYVWWD